MLRVDCNFSGAEYAFQQALLYVPEDPPSKLFQSTEEVGVALHSRRVLVKKCATDIIPKWLGFLKGVVDCDDIPLNVSRENMQNSALVEKLSQIVVRRILKFFDDQVRPSGSPLLILLLAFGTPPWSGRPRDNHVLAKRDSEAKKRLLESAVCRTLVLRKGPGCQLSLFPFVTGECVVGQSELQAGVFEEVTPGSHAARRVA